MAKFWVNCAVVLFVVSGCLGLPQGRRERRQQKEAVQQQDAAAHLDPTMIDQGMNDEHAKLIQNLQRLKRTLDTVKERVGKGTYGESAGVDMKNPEGAILAVLKSLQEQGQLFAMINDMLKAGSEIQNQTQKIQEFSKLAEQARAESVIAEHTNQLSSVPQQDIAKIEAPKSAPLPSPSVGPTDLTEAGPIASASRAPSTYRKGSKQSGEMDPAKQHGYDDYQYQYSDDSGRSSGDDQYDYHYDAQGYDSPRSRTRDITTTTTTGRPSRRVRGRSRGEYY